MQGSFEIFRHTLRRFFVITLRLASRSGYGVVVRPAVLGVLRDSPLQ